MEIIGIIHRIEEVESHGYNYQTKFFYLKYVDGLNKTQYLKFRLSNGRIDLLDGFEIGNQVQVVFSLEGNEVKNDKNEMVIFDRKEVYSIQGFSETKIEEVEKTDLKLYELKDGEEDEPLKF